MKPELQRLLQTPVGQFLREELILLMNRSTGEIIECASPELPSIGGKPLLSATHLRERSILARGAMENSEYILGVYLGGVP